MPKQHSFIDFLQQKHPSYKNIWMQLLTTLPKNQYIQINELGYIFWFQNNLSLLFNPQTFSSYKYTHGKELLQYFKTQKQIFILKKLNDEKQQHFFDLLEIFVHSYSKPEPGHYSSAKLKIPPLGQLNISGKTISYFNRQIKWILDLNKNFIQRLPKILIKNDKQENKSQKNDTLNQMQRKFSLSLKKQHPLRPTLKRISSAKNLLNQSQINSKKEVFSKQFFKDLHFNNNLNSHHGNLSKNLQSSRRQNRILKLKTQTEDKKLLKVSQNKVLRNFQRKIKCKTLQSQPTKKQQKQTDFSHIKVKKSSSCFQLERISNSFKQPKPIQGFKSTFDQLRKNNQSLQKIKNAKKLTPDKINHIQKPKIKTNQLKISFFQNINKFPNKLKLQIKTAKSNTKQQTSLEILRTQKNDSLKKMERTQRIYTDLSRFQKTQTKDGQNINLNKNYHFYSEVSSEEKSFDVKQQRNLEQRRSQQKNYENKFLRKALSKDRVSLQQAQKRKVRSKKIKKFIVQQKSQNLVSKIYQEFPLSSQKIDQMIQQFQYLWEEKFQARSSQWSSNYQFNQNYNILLDKKVEIYQQKLKRLQSSQGQKNKKQIDVKKLVTEIEQKLKKSQNSDQIETPQLNCISFLKFKSEIQQQLIKKAFEFIKKLEKNVQKISISYLEKLQILLNQKDCKFKKLKKEQRTLLVLNFEQYFSENKSFLDKIQEIIKAGFQVSDQNRTQTLITQKNIGIGPQIAIKLRQIYFILQSNLKQIGQYLNDHKTKGKLVQFFVKVCQFQQKDYIIDKQINFLNRILSDIEKKVEIYFKPFKIQQWQKQKNSQIELNFTKILKEGFESEQYTKRQQFYLSNVKFIFEPCCYHVLGQMLVAVKNLDEIYESQALMEEQKIQRNCLTIDIFKAKSKLYEKVRLTLIDVQNSYEQLLCNFILDAQIDLRTYVQIKPEMLFQQNYLLFKNKYIEQLNHLEDLFLFLLERKMIYLNYKPRTLSQIFKNITQKKLQIRTFLQNLDSRLKLYRKDMEVQMTEIEKIDKNLKDTLKQLSSKLKNFISELKDEKQILINQNKILVLNQKFQKYTKEKLGLIKRMQKNQIIYWEDDTYFQTHIKALLTSLQFVKSEYFKIVFQSGIGEIDWNLFNKFFKSYTEFIKSISETKIMKIFQTNYDILLENLNFIEVILYKNYTFQDQQRLSKYQIKLNKKESFNIKLTIFLKKIAQLNKKQQYQILNIFRKAKENNFYQRKRQKLLSIQITFQELNPMIQNFLNDCKIYQIKNQSQINDQASIIGSQQGEKLLVNIQRFNELSKELFYLKIALFHYKSLSEDQKQKMFRKHYNDYYQILSLFQSQFRLDISSKILFLAFQSLWTQRQQFSQKFFIQKVRFFPRLSLLDWYSMIDCFSWTNKDQILKNIQSLYNEVDDVILDEQEHFIKKLRFGYDYLEFQKPVELNSQSGIDFLKYFYTVVQGLIEDSFVDSIRRTCHIKLIMWHIYLTEQIQCAFLMKKSIRQIKNETQSLINQIGEQLRYDIFQHHKNFQIIQLKLFIDYLTKLQQISDVQNSYLWKSSIKMYQKNKKVIIKQYQYQYEFGYQPQKALPFQPQTKIQRQIIFGSQENMHSFKISSSITARPFVVLNLKELPLKNKIYKILDIIFKYNFFVIVNYEKTILQKIDLFKDEKINEITANSNKNFLLQIKMKCPNKLKQKKNLHLINQFYKETLYFSDYKEELEGITEVHLPILIQYSNVKDIPTNFRSNSKNFDFPSQIYSIELIILIQLNKYQQFFTKYGISLGKMSLIFKYLSQEFSISYEKMIKIVNEFDQFMIKLTEQGGVDKMISKNKLEIISELNESQNIFLSPIMLNRKTLPQEIMEKTPTFAFPNQISKNQQADQIQQQKNRKQLNLQSQIIKVVSKQLFEILIHYYPDREIEISKIIDYLRTDSKKLKEVKDQVSEAIQNIKNEGKNVIVYGKISQKTTLIKKHLKYGKNQIIYNDNQNNSKNIVVYYLEGYDNYLQLKKTSLKFVVEMQSMHEITAADITQNLVYVHPPSQKEIQQRFMQRIKQIFQMSNYRGYFPQSFQSDCWKSFYDLNQIYILCGGMCSLVSKIDIFFNILEKQLMVSSQQRTNKKTDSKILLKKIITVMIQIFIYSIQSHQRKRFIIQSKQKKYFKLTELKGVNVQDLHNYTSISLETQKIQQLVKRQRFPFKNIFPIDREIALVRKYYLLEKKYTEYFLNPSEQILQDRKNNNFLNNQKILILKNFSFFFITENYIIDKTIQKFFSQQFGTEFTHCKQYVPNHKLIQKCMKSIWEKNNKSHNINSSQKIRTLCMIEDLHMSLPSQEIMMKILIDHFTELQKQTFFVFFMERQKRRNIRSEKHKKIGFQFRPCLTFSIGQYSIESIFKYQVKNGVHQNIMQKTKKIRNQPLTDLLKDDVDFLKFVLDCKVKLPSQLYDKYYLNSLLLSALNWNSSLKGSRSQTSQPIQISSKFSLQELRNERNFDLKIKNTISSIEKTLDITYKETVFIKKRTYIEIVQADIVKALERFDKNFEINEAERINYFFYPFQERTTSSVSFGIEKRQKQQRDVNSLQSYLIKSHLSKYLHLVMSQQRTYVIQEETTLLPYLVTFLHQQRLYTIFQESTFFTKFIEIIENEMKIAKQKQLNIQQSRQNFIILVKPPLATSQLFTYFLSLVIKKVSFLNFHKEFQNFLTHEKEKAKFIFNLPSLYQTKIKAFYDIVFQNCKFIISVKECHKELFTHNIQNQDGSIKERKTIIFQLTKDHEQMQKKKSKRMSQRDSLGTRHTSLRKEVNFVQNKLRKDDNKRGFMGKLSAQFWKSIIYINASMNNEQKLEIAEQLMQKYFLELTMKNQQKERDQQQTIKVKSRDKIQRQNAKNLSQQQLKTDRLYKRLRDKSITILQKILSEFNLSINQIERTLKQMIQQVNIMLNNKKRSSFSFMNDKSIKIPQNIYQIKTQINQKISLLQSQTLSQQNLINQLLSQLKKYNEPLKQQQFKWMNKEIIDVALSGYIRKQDQHSNLPLRQIRQKTYYHTNFLSIENLKKSFYSSNLQEIELFYQKNKNSSQQFQKDLESQTFLKISTSTYEKIYFFRKLVESFQQNDEKKQIEKLIDQSFRFVEHKLVPVELRFEFIKLLYKQRQKSSQSQLKIQQKISIKDNIAQLNQNEEKKEMIEKQKLSRKSIDKSRGRLSIKKNRELILSTNQMPKLKLKLDYQQKQKGNNLKLSIKRLTSVNIIEKDNEFLESGKQLPISGKLIQSESKQRKFNILQMDETEFVNQSSEVKVLDLILKRYFNFLVQLYDKYEFQNQQIQLNSQEQKEKKEAFNSDVKKAKYFLILDILTLQKNQRDSLRSTLQQLNNQLQLLDKYVDMTQKLKDQSGILGNIEQSLQSFQLPLYLRIQLYQKIYLNTLSNINSNYKLNKNIKQILEIQGEKGILPQFLLTSNKNMEFPQSQRIQLKTLEERNKIIIADPYNKFAHLVSEINGEIFYIEEFNQKQLRKIRFKLSFYVIYLETVDDYFQKRQVIQKVEKLINQKSTDTKQSNEKLCLLVSSKNLLDILHVNLPEYIQLNLSFTYINFMDSLNFKQQSLCKNQIKDLLTSYNGILNTFREFSLEIQKYSVDQKQIIFKRLTEVSNSLFKKLQQLKNEIQIVNSDKTQNKKQQGKYQIVHEYLIELIQEQLVPYNYFKRIQPKINWDKLQQYLIHQKLISDKLTFMKNQNYNKVQSRREIKNWLAKQLYSLKTQFFIDQFRECIQISNVVIIVYDILPQKVFKDIKTVSQQMRKQFTFYFDFQKLNKKDLFVEINLLQGVYGEGSQKNTRIITRINDSSANTVNKQRKRINHEETLYIRSFGKKDTLRRRLQEESNKLNEDLRKKSVYFVNEKQFLKIKNVIHFCQIIWV